MFDLQKKRWLQSLAEVVVKWLGWKVINITDPMAYKKAVIILAPHTSNWDFFYGILFKFMHPAISMRFAIKKEVMFFPLSYLMKALGAIPIDRQRVVFEKGKRTVSTMAHMLCESEKLLLVIAPEGTRGYAKRWKTGFYRIAEVANVPIILGYLNYATKEMGVGPVFYPTGDIDKDMMVIQDFYRRIPGKYIEKGVL